jgi:hypothetical protein
LRQNFALCGCFDCVEALADANQHDFKNKELICFAQAGLGASKFPWCQWLFILHPVSLDSIHCSNANLHFYRYDSRADVIVFSSDNVIDLGRSQPQSFISSAFARTISELTSI